MKEYENINISVGIDIASKNHHATIISGQNAQRSILAQFFFQNSSKGFTKFLRILQSHLPDGHDPSEVTVAMEATAHFYLVVSRWLQHQGLRLIICNPRQSKYLRNVLKPYFKTDPIDSHVLAIGADLGLLKGEVYTQEIAHLKELLQIRRKLSHDLTGLKNQVTRLVDLIFPERASVFRDLFSKTSLAVLQIAPTPADLLEFGQRGLAMLMIRRSYNRLGLKHAKQLLELASSSVGINDTVWVYELKLLLPRLLHLQELRLRVITNSQKNRLIYWLMEKTQ